MGRYVAGLGSVIVIGGMIGYFSSKDNPGAIATSLEAIKYGASTLVAGIVMIFMGSRTVVRDSDSQYEDIFCKVTLL